MSKRPWMPFYARDFIFDTQDLDASEIGIYAILLMLMWQREDAALENDHETIKRALKFCIKDFHGHTYKRVIPKLLTKYFELGADNKWRNPRLTKERAKADSRESVHFARILRPQKSDKRPPTSNEINDLETVQSQSHKKDLLNRGEGKESGRQKNAPRHGQISRRHGTVFVSKASTEWIIYEENYRLAHGSDPPLASGGYWFKIIGEEYRNGRPN